MVDCVTTVLLIMVRSFAHGFVGGWTNPEQHVMRTLDWMVTLNGVSTTREPFSLFLGIEKLT